MIPQRNISLIANKLVTAGGRRIPEAIIERDYVLAWFLTGLAGHPLRDVLAFKGGTASPVTSRSNCAKEDKGEQSPFLANIFTQDYIAKCLEQD